MRRTPPVELTCKKCGVLFTRSQWQHKNNIRRGRINTYCSTTCASKVHRKPAVVKTESERIEAARKGYTEACPVCNQHFLKVITTRITKQNYRRRNKHCQNCDYRVATIEVPEYVLEEHLQTNVSQPQETIACLQCEHNNRNQERCDWVLPEYMTDEAHDCNHLGKCT
jgi:transcriptional regulator NrdR family protein